MFSGNVQHYLELLEESVDNSYDDLDKVDLLKKLEAAWELLDGRERDLIFRQLR